MPIAIKSYFYQLKTEKIIDNKTRQTPSIPNYKTYAKTYRHLRPCLRLLRRGLHRTGGFPTIDLIRERIGVNSPVTIKKAMNEWTRHFAEQHFDKLNRPDVPAALANAMEQAWKLAVLEAEKAYRQKERGYQDTIVENRVAMEGVEQEKVFLKQALSEAWRVMVNKNRTLSQATLL